MNNRFVLGSTNRKLFKFINFCLILNVANSIVPGAERNTTQSFVTFLFVSHIGFIFISPKVILTHVKSFGKIRPLLS